MSTDPRIESLFAECLDRAQAGEDIESILTDHPNEREWLQPMLESAAALAGFTPDPDPSLKTVGRLRFHGAVRSRLLREDLKPRRGWFSGGLSPLARAWVGGLAVLVLTIGIGGGATAAAAGAMPESPLYGIKRLTERARLAMTASETQRADMLLAFADERVRELTVMAEEGKVDQVDRLRRDLVRQVELAQAERGVPPMTVEPMGGVEAAAQESPKLSKAMAPEHAEAAYDPQPYGSAESRALAARFQREYQEHLAALAAAQQHADPSARESLVGALDEIRSRYLAVPAGEMETAADPLGRILLIRGVATKRDGAWHVGGRTITFVGAPYPDSGDFIVLSGILSPDGSIHAVAVSQVGRDAPHTDHLALQAPLLGVGDGWIAVGDYTVVLPEGAFLKPDVRLGMWLDVRGRISSDGSILADSVYVIGVYPGPFAGRP